MENKQEERPEQRFLNKFEVLKSRVMNIGEESGGKRKKDRKTVLREERLKEGKKEKRKKIVEVRKVEGEKLLREVMVKIELSRRMMKKELWWRHY